MKTIILPDLHGCWKVAETILSAENADKVISVGDAIHGGITTHEKDLQTLQLMQEHEATLILGNHEYPFLGGISFYGYDPLNPSGPTLKDMKRSGNLVFCAIIEGYLITHAGCHPKLEFNSVEDAYEKIIYSPSNYLLLLDPVGYSRGGSNSFGGILWRDDHEERLAKFPQIYGHTPGNKPRWHGKSVCIDLGLGLQQDKYAWVVIEDGNMLVKTSLGVENG